MRPSARSRNEHSAFGAEGTRQIKKPTASPNRAQRSSHMDTIDRHFLISRLHWRHATKQFDPNRKIGAEDWAVLEMALVLSPSGYGLQPWTFVAVSDPATRKKLLPASRGHRQIVEASHLVVFTVKTNFGEQDVDAYVRRMSEVRHVSLKSLAPIRSMLVNAVVRGMDKPTRRVWESCQAYLALGTLLTTAALLEIDAAPIEDIIPAGYDAVLGLSRQRLTTVVACALGYQSSEDKCSSLSEVRFRTEDILLHA